MIKRTIKRIVEGASHSSKEERIEAILNFAKYNLVPEDTISESDIEGKSDKDVIDYLYKRAEEVYENQVAKLRDEEAVREFQKVLILRVVDSKWTDHIDAWINCVMLSVSVVMHKTILWLNTNQKDSVCSTI